MSDAFFSAPILNSPYEIPSRHWELDAGGQPTQQVLESRRKADFVTPIPKSKKQGKGQLSVVLDEGKGLSTESQTYLRARINELRGRVGEWRQLANPAHWNVTPETARLLRHWRHYQYEGVRPFFCQVEAVETLIWLTEVAPAIGAQSKGFTDYLAASNAEANPGLDRLALKLATGAGKTTVMAMLIAWQTINAVRHPGSKRFTRGFLITTPGITIKDRLRVLQPNDPDSYYGSRELVPSDLVSELGKAKIIITNYHAYKLRERIELSKGGRALLQGHGPALDTLESEGQMLQRVMPELMAMKNVIAINDEAHHCYREKPLGEDEELSDALKGDDRKEAEENKEAARLWISGLEAVTRKLGLRRVVDLSATPFFLSGSGYVEGTLFPWTMSDFSLMDAIECGIVKLPRVPVADNIPEAEMPQFRNLWDHIGKKMPKKAVSKGVALDPQSLPTELKTALEALYGHYAKTFVLWQENGLDIPPCFIVVCNNTAASKLVYEYISGFRRGSEDNSAFHHGALALFRNFDEHGTAFPRPRTLLIDSAQIESGDALDDNFRAMAAEEIDQLRNDRRQREGSGVEEPTDQDLLREVLNTVGKRGKLGEQIRCVVSVSMLTEGWDANTVTHVLGVRAFGTQLLCEQVIGRALRRQSYEINPDTKLFDVEYADVLGIPFDFTAKPVIAPPQAPRETIHVQAVAGREACAIRFPRVEGYRVELPEERLVAEFTDDHTLVLTPEMIGPSITHNQGIIGEGVNLTLEHTADMRQSTVIYRLTERLLMSKWRDANKDPELYRFGQLKRIVREWLENHLVCKGGTYPAQLLFQDLTDKACERIQAAIVRKMATAQSITAMLDPYNPEGSSRHISFNTTKMLRWQTDSRRCQLNWIICDSSWEQEFCRVVEGHPRVRSYVKNHSLHFEVPYRAGSEARKYRPDFIVRLEDGHGEDDLLNLVVEIKGRRGEDAKIKASTMTDYWVPAVNNLGSYGRWAVAEFADVYAVEADFSAEIEAKVTEMLDQAGAAGPAVAP